MKHSSVFALTLCGALAIALVGCKYDDTEGNSGAGDVATAPVDDSLNAAAGTDVATDPNANTMPATAVDPSAAYKDSDTIPLDAAQQKPFDQDDRYVRCTDVDFAPVYFGFDASALVQSEMAKIEAVANHLVANPKRVVIVEGNCDERGSNEYNLSLGELRAISIRDYLLQLGIAQNRVQTKSYGEEKPAVSGTGEAAWSKNRRGEFAVFQEK